MLYKLPLDAPEDSFQLIFGIHRISQISYKLRCSMKFEAPLIFIYILKKKNEY